MESKPGRPRSAQTRQAILDAAAELLESDGYDEMSISAIADRSGAGRQTIYRLWGSKAGLAAEVVLSGRFRMPPIRMPHTASLRDDLIAILSDAIAVTRVPSTRSLIRALAAASAAADSTPDDATGNIVTQTISIPLAERVASAPRGALRADVRPSLLVDAIVGLLTLEVLGGTRLDETRIAGFIDVLLQGASA
ncbi:TetR/AcrR family transcriptional regulator [Microbacterium mangrovi]|uniref:TetR/AcrR family transcriptional regulator n=1 Tax=Microbacterium mangrovi TaxID=1348253 RepID=UPI00068BBC4F|nr:TetR/AcrR family transcriptional regulator [Microbacterium mangrovi]